MSSSLVAVASSWAASWGEVVSSCACAALLPCDDVAHLVAVAFGPVLAVVAICLVPFASVAVARRFVLDLLVVCAPSLAVAYEFVLVGAECLVVAFDLLGPIV